MVTENYVLRAPGFASAILKNNFEYLSAPLSSSNVPRLFKVWWLADAPLPSHPPLVLGDDTTVDFLGIISSINTAKHEVQLIISGNCKNRVCQEKKL